MNRLLSITLFAGTLIFAGLTQCLISAMKEEWHEKIMPLGWIIVASGFLIISTVIALFLGIFTVLVLFNYDPTN